MSYPGYYYGIASPCPQPHLTSRPTQDEIVERIKFREHCEVEEAKARVLVRESEGGTH